MTISANANVLKQAILEDAYETMQKMIAGICWKFTKRYGGEFEEWLSEANLIFIDAFNSHTGKRSSLLTWVWLKIHWGLYTVIRQRCQGKRVVTSRGETGVIVRSVNNKVLVKYDDGIATLCRPDELTPLESVSLDDMDEDENGASLFAAPVQQSIVEAIRHAAESSQELWELILDPPEELKDDLDINDPETTWDAIRRYCEYKLRWTWREMMIAVTELKEICDED